jgi:small-conductance mechanosensitive channel
MVLETANRVSDEVKAEALDADDAAPDAADAAEPAAATSRELFTPQLLATVRKVVPGLWLMAVLVAGFVSGVELAFLVAAAGVLTGVITLMWSSVQSLTGGTSLGFEEALGMGAPSKVEEQKRAVLRALKDLDFERGVGKISPEDYAELSAKYRAEAKRLMQSLDETLEPARQRVERQLKQRLERAGIEPEPEPEDSADKSEKPRANEEEP